VQLRGLVPAGAAPSANPRLEARVLPMSPLWGISLMARGSPAPTVGGGALLPLHFELGRDVPMLLELSPDGEPLQATRVTNRIDSRQLSLVATGPQQLLAHMRDDAEPQGYVQRARSDDGGRHWRDLPPLGLYNPDSALDALRLPDGSLVLALNPDQHERKRLVLMRSFDGGEQWRQEALLDDEPNTSLLGPARYRGLTEYSYPTLALQGNELHVSYTLHRRQIRHRRFALEPTAP
jgi:predicted neuraminidase